ncbi:ATP-binding cassette domain-containing protein [Chloroflexota bacterium]
MDEQRKANLAIITKKLTKRYSENMLAVDGINLSIPTNKIYALLGPNGAGKTTTINMLTTLIKPSHGSAMVVGFDIVNEAGEVRRRIGTTFQETVVDDDLTGRQVLDYHGRLYGQGVRPRHEKIAKLLALVELEDAADRRAGTYSGGMKRRLELARGLMTEPEVLFLDEPTLGLDPQNRVKIWDYILNLKERSGLTVLLTTHYMDEAEKLADRVGIIDHGHIIIEGTPSELIDQMGADTIRISGQGDSGKFLVSARGLPFVHTVTITDGLIQIGIDSGNRRLAKVVSLATGSGFTIDDISVAKPSLGDVFLKYTGHQLRDI